MEQKLQLSQASPGATSARILGSASFWEFTYANRLVRTMVLRVDHFLSSVAIRLPRDLEGLHYSMAANTPQ